MSLRKVATLLAFAALAACSSNKAFNIESKKVDYKSESGKLAPLEIPPDLSRPTSDDRFAVPDVNPRPTATYSDYSRDRAGRPATAARGDGAVLPQQDNVRLERDGNQRWLVVKGTPQQVWSTVKDFWLENGFVINVEAPESGIMETDWAENRAQINEGIRTWIGKVFENLYSTGERDKFRTRIEAGTQPGTTEIYISHRGMEEVYVSNATQGDIRETRWQPRASDPNLEVLMLGKMMTRFGVDDTRAQAQVAKGGTAVPPRATLSRTGTSGGTLALDDQFDRAWRRVGLALDRVGFTVEDRDRTKGLYFVRYIDPRIDQKAEDKSWFSNLKFWSSKDQKPKTEQYRIEVKDASSGGGCQVKVLNKDGAQDQSETAGRILALLYDQLK